jgi:hypothetical protein
MISCVRPLLAFFVVDPEAYKPLFIYLYKMVIELILMNLMHDMCGAYTPGTARRKQTDS